MEHEENDTYYYYDCKFYESGVVVTWIDRYQRVKGGNLEGLLNHITEFNHQQLIQPKSPESLLLREHEEDGKYSISHWKLATQTEDDFIVLNLSHYPLRPDEVPKGLYEKYQCSIEDIIHDIDYMLVHAKIKSH